jgi:flagellar biosynthesis GTPase FlhF
MATQGFSFETIRPLTQLEQFFTLKVHESAPQAATNVLAAQWNGPEGQKALVIISYIKIQQPMFTGDIAHVWLYNTDFLMADKDSFDGAVQSFVEANLSIKDYPEWKNHVAAINSQRREETRRQTQQQIESNNRATRELLSNHQRTMAERQASFDAHQRNMADRSAASDASHAAFMNNSARSGTNSSATSSGGQQGFLNMINEEETVTHPNGNRYQVEAGAREYWMDSNGNYIKSNDLFYNPNAYLNNTMEWAKVKD